MSTTRGLVIALALGLLAGCGEYHLAGRVVEGPRPQVLVVHSDDPRLAGPPIESASIEAVLDPNSAGRTSLGTVFTDESGRFSIPVDALGAGALEYEVMILARGPKRAPAQAVVALPPRGREVLVVLPAGRDRAISPRDPIRDAQRDIERHFPQ
jgi:hypothetical protein